MPKDAPAPTAYGDVDEAQAVLGVARAECERGSELDEMLIGLERDLWVLMAELATDPANRHKLVDGPEPRHRRDGRPRSSDASTISPPGSSRRPSSSCPAQTVSPPCSTSPAPSSAGPSATRWRCAAEGSHVVPYLNRLSDLLWTMARWQEGESLPTKETRT